MADQMNYEDEVSQPNKSIVPIDEDELLEFKWYCDYISPDHELEGAIIDVDDADIDPLLLCSSEELTNVHEFEEDIKRQLEDKRFQDDDDSDDTLDGVMYSLVEASAGSITTYDLLAKVLKQSLLEFGYQEKRINNLIWNYRCRYLSENKIADEIKEYIKKIKEDASVKDKVSVLPLMCGTGKSTAITKLIIETIKRINWAKREEEKKDVQWIKDPFEGLLIVTDSKERLQSLWKTRENLSKDENKFIEENSDSITVMTEDNVQIAEQEQRKKPVLL